MITVWYTGKQAMSASVLNWGCHSDLFTALFRAVSGESSSKFVIVSDYKFSKCSSKNSPMIVFFNQLDDPCFDPTTEIWKFHAGWNLIFAIKLEECWGYDFETDFCSSGPTQVLKFSSGLYLALNAAFAVISLNHSAINFNKK